MKQADGRGAAVRASGSSLSDHDRADIHPSDDPGEASIKGAEALTHPLEDDEQLGRVEETPHSLPLQKPTEPLIYASEPNRVVVQNPHRDKDHAPTVGDSLTTQTSQSLQPSLAQPKLETPRISAAAASRTMRGAESTETGQRNHSGVAQSSVKAAEGLGELTDPGVARSIANQFGAKPAIRGGASVESEVSKTFESLDAAVTVGAPTWVHTGERRAEAGFRDPTLGWIGIRANVDGTGIHAAIIPNSIDAAQELGGHLEGMSVYLATHHTSLESLTLGEPERHSSTSDMNGQAQHGTNHSEHQQADQDADRDEATEQGIRNRNARFSLDPVDIAVRPATTGGHGMGIGNSTASGAHVSVIA